MRNIRKAYEAQTQWYVFVPTGECVVAHNQSCAVEKLKRLNPSLVVDDTNVLLESEFNDRRAAGEYDDGFTAAADATASHYERTVLSC